jgi:hypothetical protein
MTMTWKEQQRAIKPRIRLPQYSDGLYFFSDGNQYSSRINGGLVRVHPPKIRQSKKARIRARRLAAMEN